MWVTFVNYDYTNTVKSTVNFRNQISADSFSLYYTMFQNDNNKDLISLPR